MSKTFYGGTHPPENKLLTQNLALADLPLPDKLVVSLTQHFGKPALPVVKKGDIVNEGDFLAIPDGPVSAPIHAPVSGKITQITKAPHVLGILQKAIVIERDKSISPKIWERNNKILEQISLTEFIEIIKNMGIVGLGGAAFPTYLKFMPREKQKIETIIINACECEPYINADYRAILDEPNFLIEGINLIKKVTGVAKISIGIEDHKIEAIKVLNNKTVSINGLKVVTLETKYPQGQEKMLIKAVLGKEVPKRGLPLDIGVIVVNVNTVIAIAKAVFYDKPIIERTITVSGNGVVKPQNLRVKVGTLFSDILAYCGKIDDKIVRLAVGGPMMGIAQKNDLASVLKSTTGLLALSSKEVKYEYAKPCIKCGTCVANCPMRLVPADLAKFVLNNRIDLAEKNGLLDCMECGVCVFNCPARIPIVQCIKIAKLKVKRGN